MFIISKRFQDFEQNGYVFEKNVHDFEENVHNFEQNVHDFNNVFMISTKYL